jgi:hypothetical protein
LGQRPYQGHSPRVLEDLDGGASHRAHQAAEPNATCLTTFEAKPVVDRRIGPAEYDAHQRETSIIPGYSHYNFGTSPELGRSIEKFLDDTMTKPQGGEAAAASRAAP